MGQGRGEASHDHTSARDKMFVCQLSYSLDNVSLVHVDPLNERLSTDFNGFYRCLLRGREAERDCTVRQYWLIRPILV